MTSGRDLFDKNDVLWTIDQAAEHLGYKPATIRKYIREGLTLHFGAFVHRDELLKEYRDRMDKLRESQIRHTKPGIPG